jgi:hypothetical protein
MKSVVFFFLLSFPIFTYSQIKQRNLLGTKYPLKTVRQLLTPLSSYKPYPRTAEEWQQALPDSIRTKLIRAGEKALTKEFMPISAALTLEYVRTGDRNKYQKVSFGKRTQLTDLVLAESIEGKGRFTDAIMNGVWSICEESFWGVPAHLGAQKARNGLPDVEDRIVDLFAAETAAVLALADYLTGEQLDKASPLIRQRIYYETNQRIFEPISHTERYAYLKPNTKVNNWNPWIMANWLTATLLLERDEKRRADMVYNALAGLDLYLNGLGDEGGCDEGPSYWFVAGACVFDALELLHSATQGRINVYQEPLIRNMASYIYKMHIDQRYFVDFADADPTLTPDGLMLYRFGKAIGDHTLVSFGKWANHTFGAHSVSSSFNRQRRIQNLLTMKEITSQPAVPYTGIKDAWFPDVQVMTARTGKGLYLAAHGGHNGESHNHNDVGDFILYANGQPVIIDVGRGTYTAKTFSAKRYDIWYNQSEYHNLPVINGMGQLAGKEYEAQQVSYQARGTASVLKMDLAKAYPKEAGITTWKRTLTLNREKELVEILDEYTLLQPPKSLQQSFMTICQTDISKPGNIVFTSAEGTKVLLQYDADNWQAGVETIPLTTPEDESLAIKWAGKPIQRVLLTRKSPASAGKVLFTFKKI